MANIQGTNVTSGITPFTTADTFPTHYAEYGKGGFRTVNTIEERNAIPYERREAGMLVYVINDDSNVHTYQWFPDESGDQNKEWKRSKMGGGDSIPIYDSAKLEELGDAAEDDYIFIPSKSDGNGEVVGNTYTTTKNGNYIDVLFSAIRQLQSEVARLRNAFNYGIYSYSGTDTAMSRVQGVYEGDPDEEPLWAIDEDGLSLQKDLISDFDEFSNKGSINHTTEGLPYFTEESTWSDQGGAIAEIKDSKLFLYLTSNNPNITICLGDKTDLTNSALGVRISLIYLLRNSVQLDWYNILVVISREQEVEDEEENVTYFGSNFIWISVSNPKTNDTVAEGYLDAGNGNLVKHFVAKSSRFTINSIEFNPDTQLSKAIIYSKYQDFSKEVIPSEPTDSSFSYKAAHITIRSVSTYSILNDIKDQLPENELIFVEDTKKLYIKNNNRLVAISGAGNEPETPPVDDTMTAEEILQALVDKGIINYDSTNKHIELNSVEGITFVNEDTGKQFEVSVDAYGNLVVDEITGEKITLSSRLNRFSDFPPEDTATPDNIRGFVGLLKAKEEGLTKIDESFRLFSDRIKIGSFYAPLKSQLTFGCSHGFIELENTSAEAFQLDGCYLHYARKFGSDVHTSHLALTGEIPAGGTYLIRCKQYSDFNDPNTFIKVEHYDIEWYEKDITVSPAEGQDYPMGNNNLSYELIDLSHTGTSGDPHGLALTYGKTFGTSPFTYKCKVWGDNKDSITKGKAKYLYWSRFIDAVYYNVAFKDSASNAYWTTSKQVMASKKDGIFVDAIYKNTFELDPAQQAYQSLNTYDSSRYRNANAADYQYILLNDEYISFPKTDEIYPVNKFTPKASFEKRNVLTDKNRLNLDKPNCVTCSFGINPYTTRTFNWVSSGYFDEYVWVRERKEQAISWKRFSSYTEKAEGTTVPSRPNTDDGFPWRKEFDSNINNIIYNRIYGYFPGDKNCTYTSHKCILDVVRQAVSSKTTYEYVVGRSLANGEPDPEHTSRIMTFTLYPKNYSLRIYQTTDQQGFHWIEYQAWGAAANYINDQINTDLKNEHEAWESAYAAWEQEHEAWESAYAAWEQEHEAWINGGKNGEEPIMNQEEPIAPVESGIIPILMNTGDMTQSGSRVNEWVDYYNAGSRLFDHLEQVNCVGNNDLCGTIVTDLGTGDDLGKSNSFYFHVFYCYEVDTVEGKIPIIRGKYIPSLYHIDFEDFRIVMVNSEITYENCKTWFKTVINYSSEELLELSAFNNIEDNEVRKEFDNKIANGVYSVVNIYTGWTVETTNHPKYVNNFTSIYTLLYHMLSDIQNKECIVACHEMPFTVITNNNLASTKIKSSRSADENSLVGSHLNQLNTNDTVAIYWFSRLLESTGVRLCLGGHKHTYSQTWPIRENYYYKDGNSWKSSLSDGPMTMTETLSNEDGNVEWILKPGDNRSVKDVAGTIWAGNSDRDVHLSKFPIIEDSYVKAGYLEGYISPATISSNPDPSKGVIYFMCQATGFKLMSNKELPAPRQVFSEYLPKSNASTASDEQRCPMYAVIDLKTTVTGYSIVGRLIRLNNIQSAKNVLFSQISYGTGNISYEYLYDNSSLYSIIATNNDTSWYYGGWHNLDNPQDSYVYYPSRQAFPEVESLSSSSSILGKTLVAEDTGKSYKVRNIQDTGANGPIDKYIYIEGDVNNIIDITIDA